MHAKRMTASIVVASLMTVAGVPYLAAQGPEPDRVVLDRMRGFTTEFEFFRVKPADQDRLLRQLTELSDALADQPGFLAAVVHRDVDGDTAVVVTAWADAKSQQAGRRAGRVSPLERRCRELATEHDLNVYESVDSVPADGQPMVIRRGKSPVAVIDVIHFTKPENWDRAIEFHAANGRAFGQSEGFRRLGVFASIDRKRIATYGQWESTEAFLMAVRRAFGGRMPALDGVRKLGDLNAVLQEAGKELGSRPEYHAYEVALLRSSKRRQ